MTVAWVAVSIALAVGTAVSLPYAIGNHQTKRRTR